MAEFAYNNTKNANTNYTPFKHNYSYYPKVFFEKDINFYLKSCSTNKLAEELKKLIEICYQNLLHVLKLQNRVHDKGIKSHSYALGEKVWLNSKYIKTKKNKKLKSKFFRPFQVLYLVRKQAYKLELPTKWRIHKVFYMLLLE